MRWSIEERAWLRESFGRVGREELARVLGRTWPSIRSKAVVLGLRARPDGSETLREAARRTGYTWGSLKSLIARQAVPTRRGYGRDHARQNRPHVLYVDRRELDAAIRRDMAMETLAHAAHRYRGVMGHHRLRRTLVAAQVMASARRGQRGPNRLDPTSVDLAVRAALAA